LQAAALWEFEGKPSTATGCGFRALKIPEQMLWESGAFECEDCLQLKICWQQVFNKFRSKPDYYQQMHQGFSVARRILCLLS
jgi:hypothetical protein